MHVFDTRKVKARVNHRCDLCGMTIEKGTEYTKIDVVDGGSFGHFTYHQECASAATDEDWEMPAWAFSDFRSAHIGEIDFERFIPWMKKPALVAESNTVDSEQD